MKNLKIFIVTYKRTGVLNETLDRLFNKTDFSSIPNTEVNIINNHSEFELNPAFADIAVPMLQVYKEYKMKNFEEAYDRIGLIKASDWRTACLDWVRKREKSYINNARS